jgi:nitrate reductase assembly molybdenum cofactor insertion protein NarJ
MKQMPGKTVKVQEILETQNLMTLGEQQEYYLMTFDVQAVCCPDLGYLLFGEDYKRAQLLVNLKKEHSLAGVDCGKELGDYLPNILTLLERTTDRNFAEELGFIITIPAGRFIRV